MIIHSNFLSFQIGGIRVPKNVIIVCIGAGDVLGRFSSFVAILPNLRLESHEQMEVPVSTKSAQRTAQLEQIKDAMKGDKRLFWLLALEAKSLLALIWYQQVALLQRRFPLQFAVEVALLFRKQCSPRFSLQFSTKEPCVEQCTKKYRPLIPNNRCNVRFVKKMNRTSGIIWPLQRPLWLWWFVLAATLISFKGRPTDFFKYCESASQRDYNHLSFEV